MIGYDSGGLDERPVPRLLAGWPAHMEYTPRVPLLKADMNAALRAESCDVLISSGARRGRPRKTGG